MQKDETWDDRYLLLNQPYLRYGLVKTAVNFDAGVDSRAAVIICTAPLTVTLPLALNAPNKVYIIKNIGIGAVSIAPSGADTIDDIAGVQALLPDQYDVIMLISDGVASWFIISFSDL